MILAVLLVAFAYIYAPLGGFCKIVRHWRAFFLFKSLSRAFAAFPAKIVV